MLNQSVKSVISGFLGRIAGRSQRRARVVPAVIAAVSQAELLEHRQLLTAQTWDNPEDLTTSVAPDGTLIAGRPSTFYQTFSHLGTPTQLRRMLLEVFQSWSVHGNVNVGLVNDGGQPFGTPGEIQGDRRFGDIRIGATTMSNDVLAVSIPHSGGAAGTWAGDIVFNSSFRPVSIQQFKAVAMHEMGHTLGLEHSTDPASPMYHRNSPETVAQPTVADIAALKNLHGSRVDRNELSKSNDQLRDATRMRDTSYDGTVPLLKYGDISISGDVDSFSVDKVDLYTGPVSFRLRTGGLSLLQARLTVLDADGRQIASASATWPGQELTLTIPSLTRTAFVQVSAAGGQNPFAVGRYAVITTFDQLNKISLRRINDVIQKNFDFLKQSAMTDLFRTGTSTVFFDDLHTNDTLRTATTLKTAPGFADSTRYEFYGTLSDNTDLDFYAFKSPANVAPGTVLSVTVDAAELQSLLPVAAVFDSGLRFLSPTILRNSGGTITIQIPGIASNQTYYIKVAASLDNNRYVTGNYAVKARFTAEAETQAQIFRGQLSSTSSKRYYEMTLNHTMIFNFLLETNRNRLTANPNIATQFTLYDASGKELHRVVTLNDSTRSSSNILLVPGKYFVRINAVSQTGVAFAPLSFRLLGSVLSDPVGPIGLDPTLSPPTDGTLDSNLTSTPPTVLPPPPLNTSSTTENPYTYQPTSDPVHLFLDYQDWYWYFGMN